MEQAAGGSADREIHLSYDGRTHVLANAASTWEIRLELEQLGAGEVVGIGSVATALDAPHDGVNAEVILSGRIDPHGVASIVLTPLAASSRPPITLIVRVLSGRLEGHDPIITHVLEVRGLPS